MASTTSPSNGTKPDEEQRIAFLSAVLVGYKVEVQTKNGVVYEGIFNIAPVSDKGMSVVLKYARVVKDPNTKLDSMAERPKATWIISADDMVQLVAKDVRMNPEDLAPEDDFETDANISRGRGGAVRDLQRWMPEDGGESHEFHLEADSTGWDQFAVNKEKFGVETTFQEEIYTTRLDRSNCAITEKEAARLAREIEMGVASNPATNYHLLEERGIEVDDHGMDEEDKYSSVARQPPAPQPQAGAQQQQQQRPRPGTQPAPGGRAWGNAGAGVAVVARGLPQPPPPPPAGQQPPPPQVGMPVPGEVDLRKETNKVRSQLAFSVKKGGDARGVAPFGAPKSPISSPLVSDPQAVMALNIETMTGTSPSFTQKDLLEYTAFKHQLSQDKEKLEQAKRFQDLKATAASTSANNAANAAQAASEAPAAAPPAAAATTPAPTPGAAPQPAPAPQAPDAATATAAAPAAAPALEGKPQDTVPSEGAPAAPAAEPSQPKKGGLNPNAKPFSLNINAKSFVPTFTMPASAPAVPAPAMPPAPAPVPVALPSGQPLVPPMMPPQPYGVKAAGGPMGPMPPNQAYGGHPGRGGMPHQGGMHPQGPVGDQQGMMPMPMQMQPGAPMHPGGSKPGMHPSMDSHFHGAKPVHMMAMPPQQPQPPGAEQQGQGQGAHVPMHVPMQPMQGPFIPMQPGAAVQPMAFGPNGMPMGPMMGPSGPVIMTSFSAPHQMRPGGMGGPPGGGPTMILPPMMQPVPGGFSPVPTYGVPTMQGGPRPGYPAFGPGGYTAMPHMGMMPVPGQGGPPMQGGPGMEGPHGHGGMRGPGGHGKGMGGRGGGRGDRGGMHHYGGPQGMMPNQPMVMQVNNEGPRGHPEGRAMPPPPPPPPVAGAPPIPMAPPAADAPTSNA